MNRQTIFSPCRKYRYTLWREFAPDFLFDGGNKNEGGYVQFIGLNPSTADETKDDPTIRRCMGFAKAWGFGAMCMTNLFAWRDTDPQKMKLVDDPTGAENNTRLLEIGQPAGLIVAAWGTHGLHRDRQDWVKKMFFDCNLSLKHLGLNGDGTPRHPLYLSKKLVPTMWA
jgi:hypothetical protein